MYIKDMDCEIPMLSFGNTESDYKELSNYYRKNCEEVDLIIDTNRGVIPIEVKYKSRIDKSDLKSIRNFIMNNQSKYGIVVTENVLDNIENIYMIPFWLFVYMDNIE